MKRILTLILAVCITASFAACSDEDSSKKESSSDSAESISSADSEESSSDSESGTGNNPYKKVMKKILEKAGIIDKPYAHALDNYFKAMETGDGEAYKNSLLPCKIAYMEEEACGDLDIDTTCEENAKELKKYLSEEYGEDFKITYEIKKDKELSQKKLDEIVQEIKDSYEADVTVESAYKVKILAKIKGDNDDDTDTSTITVAKVDGEWYITEGGYI